MEARHSALPYFWKKRDDGSLLIGSQLVAGKSHFQCDTFIPEEDLKFIVLAVNAHDDLVKALKEARRAIGDHFAPDECYSTGPLTGDPMHDLVECPACSFIEMHDAALAKAG